jgi:hypothetical protein
VSGKRVEGRVGNGMMDDGIVEWWNGGKQEWNDGIIPTFQYSNIPPLLST